MSHDDKIKEVIAQLDDVILEGIAPLLNASNGYEDPVFEVSLSFSTLTRHFETVQESDTGRVYFSHDNEAMDEFTPIQVYRLFAYALVGDVLGLED